MTQDPNLSKIELIASALGPLRDRLVFVGGCAVGLLITDSERAIAAHSIRWAIWSAPNRSKSLCRGAATPGLSSERLLIISSRKPSVRYYLAYGHF